MLAQHFDLLLDFWLQGFRKPSEVLCFTTVCAGGCHGSPCERPKPNSLGADLEILGELFRDPNRMINNAIYTIQKMLGSIIGRIANEGLGIDGQPSVTIRT